MAQGSTQHTPDYWQRYYQLKRQIEAGQSREWGGWSGCKPWPRWRVLPPQRTGVPWESLTSSPA